MPQYVPQYVLENVPQYQPQQYYHYGIHAVPIYPTPPKAQYIGSNSVKPMRFEGSTKQVKVQHWMTTFELYVEGLSDKTKINTLSFFLDKEALAWYGTTVDPKTMTWDEVKESMLTRFSIQARSPYEQVKRRMLRDNETVEQYFNDKVTLMHETVHSADLRTQYAELTDGLPSQCRSDLRRDIYRFTDLGDWLRTAVIVVSDYREQKKRQEQKGQAKKSPPRCKHCSTDTKTINHFYSDCPKLKARNGKPSARVATTTNTNATEPSSPDEVALNWESDQYSD